ncbi:MAG: ATP-dependent DNA helicase RecG [Leptospiraceae bacterium]|nr:ATP-dependent DNA helicase RecG [Leptospiraceae bacterium]MCK6381483.1 ATP-dependent DNA helicase RecG [Leptospiraceae bacterium]NUM40198.1 ATP-dependent DNA helicase RecG [Leptospiraceae bacterium]
MKEFSLTDSVELLKGVGPKKKESLKSINIENFSDLLYYFPRRYLDRNLTSSVVLTTATNVTLLVTVQDFYLAHGKKSRLVVGVVTSRNERISLIFFKGLPYYKNLFKEGMVVAVSGKLDYFRGLQIVHPEIEIVSSDDPEDLLHSGRIIPLYHSTETLKSDGLDSRGFRRLIKQVIIFMESSSISVEEILPKEILKKRKMYDRKKSFTEIHFPSSDESLQEARRRFIYEEFYFFHLLMLFKQEKRNEIKRILWPLPNSSTADKLKRNLPFKLTEDQEGAVSQILDLAKVEKPMAVLLQGDVGSGKTITALLIALHYIENSIQVCFVAPTEILARQHYLSILNLLGNFPFLGIELLVGKEKEKTRKEKLHDLKTGGISMVVGTHTLFQDDVEFKDLGLVIIDEQHKFGVEQRESIRAKGKNPDIIAMTATPIPRSLTLTIYGDLKLVLIKNKPIGRKPITTKWVREEKRASVYNSIKKYLNEKRQCFIVYPLIEESEKLDLQSCIDAYEELRKTIFKEYSVGLLHGKMKSEEKNLVMEKFKKNEIHILVTTTVIEVGIDIPNATMLIVENADRFGISQLHQLRGRVGRGDKESFCILITPNKVSEDANMRLDAIVSTEDGFSLAETDLKIRGPGELLGLRQSGLPDFKIADLQKDESIAIEAREDAEKSGKISDLEKYEIRTRFSEGRILFPN